MNKNNNFVKSEEKIQKFWNDNKIFEQSLKESENDTPFTTTFQKMRKEAKLHPTDIVHLIIKSSDKKLAQKINKHNHYIRNITRTNIEIIEELNENDKDIIIKKDDFYIIRTKDLQKKSYR